MRGSTADECPYVRMYVSVCVCMYVCMCVYGNLIFYVSLPTSI